MKIVMTLLARNEQDIIQHNVEYHRSQGVDFFIATDNLSEDGTSEILRQYERKGILHYIWEGDEKYSQDVWVTRMARLAYCEYGADWVINCDADEFWWPQEGDLRSVLSSVPRNYNALRAGMHNFVPVSESGGLFYAQMIYREKTPVNLIGRPIPPKVCHRGHPHVSIGYGHHKIEGVESFRAFEGPIEVLHFPLRTYNQFERKVIVGGHALERNKALQKGIGRVMRGLYRLYKEGGLPEYYRLQVYSARRVAKELQAGFLVKDTRLAVHLQQHYRSVMRGDGVRDRSGGVTGPQALAKTWRPMSGEVGPARSASSDGDVQCSQRRRCWPVISGDDGEVQLLWATALRRYSRGGWSPGKLWWAWRPLTRFRLRSLICRGRQWFRRLIRQRQL